MIAQQSSAKTWEQAIRKWRQERGHRTEETARREAKMFAYAAEFLAGRELHTIRRADLERVRDGKLQRGCCARTANHAVQAVSAVLRAAVRWEWITSAPALERLYESPPRESFLTAEKAAELLATLPPHLRVMVAFSLETGLRQGNVRRLEWRHVQLAQNRIFIPGPESKNRKPLLIPLTPLALEMIESCKGDHPRVVFTFAGRPMVQPTNTAWYAALRRVGLRGFRWHDLRHTWASWHMEAGTHPLVLQHLGGWRTAQMVARYTHLDDTAAQAAVKQFAASRRLRSPEMVPA